MKDTVGNKKKVLANQKHSNQKVKGKTNMKRINLKRSPDLEMESTNDELDFFDIAFQEDNPINDPYYVKGTKITELVKTFLTIYEGASVDKNYRITELDLQKLFNYSASLACYDFTKQKIYWRHSCDTCAYGQHRVCRSHNSEIDCEDWTSSLPDRKCTIENPKLGRVVFNKPLNSELGKFTSEEKYYYE